MTFLRPRLKKKIIKICYIYIVTNTQKKKEKKSGE